MFTPKPLIRYADPGFSQDRTRYCTLRLQISDQELLLTIADPLSASFPLIEKYTVRNGFSGLKTHESLARVLQTHALTRLPYKSVEVIIVSPEFTLVPAPLFDSGKSDQFMELSLESTGHAAKGSEYFERQEIQLLYSWPSGWKEVILQAFPTCILHHYSWYLLQGILNQQPGGTCVYVHVQDFRQDIIVIREGKLLFFNSFPFQSPEDFLYYVLLTYDRHDLNREMIPLKLMGEIEVGSAIYSLAYKYIRDIGFMTRSGTQVVPEAEGQPEPLPDHFYFNLLHPESENN